ncbi:MAG: hypothetical protein IJA35_05245 [Clostridia bacterium]|nr:hypothetical protein [Clostridia bacterium]
MGDCQKKAEENLLKMKKGSEAEKSIRILIFSFSISASLSIISSILVYHFTAGEAYLTTLIQGIIGVSMLIVALSLYIGYRMKIKHKNN